VAIAIALAVAGYAGFALRAPIEWLTYRSTDDSYYYFQVARNVVLGHGLTFDGMHPTNGFHPLWMLCLIPVYAAAHGDAEWGLRLTFCLLAVVGGAAIGAAYRAMVPGSGRKAAAVGALVMLTPPLLNPLINGLETGLLMLLLFLALWLVPRDSLLELGVPPSRDVGLGALLGLLLLARLDSAPLVACVLAVPPLAWLRGGAGRAPLSQLVAKMLRVGATIAVVIAPYFVWDFLTFGHLMPISGGIKTTYPRVTFSIFRITGGDAFYAESLLGVSLAGLLWAGRRRGQEAPLAPGALPLLAAVTAGGLIHFLNTVLFMDFGVHWWHYASYTPGALLLGIALFAGLLRIVPRPGVVAAAAGAATALVVVLGLVFDFRARASDHERWYRAAMWSREHLPARAVVGMTDCGVFGYFSRHTTVNLDGVINGYAYQDRLRDRQLDRFLLESGITYIASSSVRYDDSRYQLWLSARLHRAPGGLIIGRPAAEVYRDAVPGKPLFVIWDLRRVVVCDDPGNLEAYRSAVEAAGH
jgi:hypothetical protein